MSKWFSKQLSSFAFSLQKTYEKIITAKPSIFVVSASAVVVSLFLFGGGIYSLLSPDHLGWIGYHPSGAVVVYYRSLTAQFILECALVMIFGAMGVAGFLIAQRSTKYAYTPRSAYRFLLVGCVLLIVGILLMETGLNTKFGL